MANLGKLALIIGGLALTVGLAGGYTASSTNYRLQDDSLNFGGGYSTSTTYRLQDTLGEIATGILTGSSTIMSGGYQAMDTNVFIAVTAPGAVTMTPAINGIGGGISNGSSAWGVQTDNPAGYELSVRSSTSPALAAGANSFADYGPSYAVPDYTWTNSANESQFGFSPEGDNLVARFKDNGLACNSGSLDSADTCWEAFSTTAEVVTRSEIAVFPGWATTTLKLRAEVGRTKAQAKGDYSATIIVTAITL